MDTATWNPASYGRACAGCAQAKTKCLRPDGGGVCARCRRLNRECRPATRVRKTSSTSHSAAARTARLEKRLDGLLSLIQETGARTATSPVPESPSRGGGQEATPSSHAAVTPRTGNQPTCLNRATPGNASSESIPSQLCDEQVLSLFRAEKLPYLPLVHIPSTTSAAQLKQSSPFLWRCITTAQCRDYTRQATLTTEIRDLASRMLLVECHRSLDILQGVLVYLGWIAFTCTPHKATLGPYVHMAISLVHDLALDKAAPQDHCTATAQRVMPGYIPHRPWISLVRSMDERRAVLACFVLASSIMHFLGRADSLRWTPHMQQSLDVLAESTETPNDAVLAQMARTHLVLSKARHQEGSDGDCPRAPVSFYIKAFQPQLELIKSQIPPRLSENKTILLHLYHAEMTVYEAALIKPTPAPNEVDLTRLDHLYNCLNAIQTFFQLYYDLPLCTYASLSANLIFPTAHCLVTLFRLTVLEYPGWDTATVRRTADVLSLSDQLIDRFGRTAEAAGAQNHATEYDPFHRAAKLVRELRAGWASKLSEMDAVGVNNHVDSSDGGACSAFTYQDCLDSWLSWSDLAWLADSEAI